MSDIGQAPTATDPRIRQVAGRLFDGMFDFLERNALPLWRAVRVFIPNHWSAMGVRSRQEQTRDAASAARRSLQPLHGCGTKTAAEIERHNAEPLLSRLQNQHSRIQRIECARRGREPVLKAPHDLVRRRRDVDFGNACSQGRGVTSHATKRSE